MKKIFGFMTGLASLFMATPVFASANPGESSMSMFAGLMPFIVLILAFYFLIIRPQKKQEREKRQMLSSLKRGDEIVTIGGVIGKVVKVKEDRITIETGSDCVKITFERGAIGRVLKADDTDQHDSADESGANKELEKEKEEIKKDKKQ